MRKAEICERLPHANGMCLLDALDRWDADSITCTAVSHRDPKNPLRSGGRLPVMAGIEYAAQAMALHGFLLGNPDRPPSMGYLASVRDCRFNVEDLSAVTEDLSISARRLSGDEMGFVYEFDIRAGNMKLASGRVTAKLVANPQ